MTDAPHLARGRPAGRSRSKVGRIHPHPRCFRESGKCRTYGIRNLEEDTEDGRQSGMMERKSQRTQRRDAECAERKVSEWNAGGAVDQSPSMIA